MIINDLRKKTDWQEFLNHLLSNGDMNDSAFRIDDPYVFLTKELLEDEYVRQGLTDKQIAAKHGIGSKVTVWRRRRFYNIGNSYPGKSNQNAAVNRVVEFSLGNAKKWKLSGMTYPQIATMLGCSRMSVCRRYKELGFVRETIHTQKKLRWHADVSSFQERFLLGTLLGDGSISAGGMFQCNHSVKQEPYIRWKCCVLNSLMSPLFELKTHEVDLDGVKHLAMYMRTLQNKHLRHLREMFYPDGVKIFPFAKLIDSHFDAFSLATWYMDDGCLGDSRNAILCTFGFGLRGNNEILGFLLGRFTICGKLYEATDRAEGFRHYVFLGKDESDKFFRLIAPYVHPSMAYKVPPAFRGQVGSLLPQN